MVGDRPQFSIAMLRADIRADESSSLKEVGISDDVGLNRCVHNRLERLANQLWRYRLGKCANNADARLRSIAELIIACPLNHFLNGLSPQRHFYVASRGARDSQHKSRRVAEIAIELDGASALWQLAVQII